MAITEYIATALLYTASTYGWLEVKCGDPGKAVPCDGNATTASGEAFNPNLVTAAVPMKSNRRLRPKTIFLKAKDGTCILVRINDKKNARFVGKGGLDLTPATVRALGYKAHSNWSGKVEQCEEDKS